MDNFLFTWASIMCIKVSYHINSTDLYSKPASCVTWLLVPKSDYNTKLFTVLLASPKWVVFCK